MGLWTQVVPGPVANGWLQLSTMIDYRDRGWKAGHGVPSGRPVGRLRPADPIVDRPERLVSSRRKHPDGGRLPDRTSDHADVGRVRGSGGAAQRCMGWLLVHVLPPAPGSRRGAQSARPQPQPYVRPLSVEGAAQELRLLPGSTRGILRPVHVGRAPQEHTIIHSGQL